MSRRQRFTRNLGRPTVVPSPARTPTRYVRFEHAHEVIDGIHFGPFSYLSDARERLEANDLAELDTIVAWFDDHLDVPERMVPFRDVGPYRARRKHQEPSAVCWFREDAVEHITQARKLVALLGRADLAFVELWSDRVPGTVCSEDEAQVAVVVYRDVRRA